MDDSAAEFLERLNDFDVSSSEIVALLNDQLRNAEEQFGRLTLTKISFQPISGVSPKRQAAMLLRLMALLQVVSGSEERFGFVPRSDAGWSDGAAFRAASRLPLQLFEDGSVGFDASSFAAEVAGFKES